jgi:thiol-disulfide isomerase/thioredoxin
MPSSLSEKPAARSDSTRRIGLAVIVLAAAFVLLLARNRGNAPATARVPLTVHPELKSLRLQPLTPQTEPLSLADLRGRVTLVSLWGPWCMYCRVELPHLDALQQQFADSRDFRFVSVTCGPDVAAENLNGLREESLAYLANAGFRFPLYADPGGTTRRAIVEALPGDAEGLGYPTNLLLDRQGRIVALWMGYEEGIEREMKVAIERCLEN